MNTARHELRELIRAKIDRQKALKLPTLVERTLQQLASDQELLQGVTIALLRPLIYEECRLAVGEGRDIMLLGEEVIAREDLPKRASKLLARWSSWMEHAGNRYVRLPEMRRPDLLLAIAERSQRRDAEDRIISVWKALADALPNDETTLEQWFGKKRLDAIATILGRVA